MKTPSPVSSEIRAEAAIWLARLRADDRSMADEQAFRDWLAACPMNAAAYEEIDRVWTVVGGLGAKLPRTKASAAPLLRRRSVVMSGAGLLSVGGVGAAMLRSPALARVYETGVGEQKRLSLQDGTQLFLDAQTKISIAFSEKLRSADLQFGRVNFRVAPDQIRPFVVEAAQRQIIADQCDLDVRCDGTRLQVVLIRGEAQMKSAKRLASATGTRIQGGERLVATQDSETFDRPHIAAVTAWQAGLQVFESKRLDEAAEEMNRYSEIKLLVAPGVADMKVSGAYKVGDNAAFARSMAKLLQIAVQSQGDGITLQLAENTSPTP